MKNSRNTMVATTGGKLEGTYEDNLYVFKGIPYAAPPIGELRWMPPQPAKGWDGVRPAKEYGTIAPQNPMAAGPIIHAEQPQDENCLFLNIWSPGLDDARRPVMVWIHGGAFTIGSGSDAMYEGGKLASRGDIVQVTINYRLGVLGFLNLNEVTGGKIPATGNTGLLDQVAALKWIKENITAFGGDPDNITVFGESAGAMSIGCLMGMPVAKGLFRKAILESGAAGNLITLEEARDIADKFLEILGIKGDDVNSLWALTPEQLLEAELKLREAISLPGEGTRLTATVPIVDGEVIPQPPNKAIREGSARGIATIVGTNRDEFRLFAMMRSGINEMDNDSVARSLKYYLPAEPVTGMIATYEASRKKRGEATAPFDLLSAVMTDAMFRISALQLIEAQRDNGQPAYSYLFNWKSPVMNGFLGSCHALEMGFVFGTYDDMFCGSGPDADRLSQCIQDAWLAFARTGDPSCDSLGNWPRYGNQRETMILGEECHVEEAPYEEERRAWDSIPNMFLG